MSCAAISAPLGEGGIEDSPVSYSGRSPHIHIRVTVPGIEELVTQHYPEPGQRKAKFNVVLVAGL